MTDSQKPVCHEKAAVLLLSWPAHCDDLKVQKEVQDLAKVFEIEYKFTVIQQELEEANPHASINYWLSKFVRDHGQQHSLLIVYYAGHGGCDENNAFMIMPKGSNEDHRGAIAWKSAETNLKPACADADVLVIFDCCDAGALAQSRAPRRIFEFLGACDHGQTTRGPGRHSFTSALILALKELSSKPTFTTKELREKIKMAPDFPGDEQRPVLFNREPPFRKHIDIQPLSKENKTPDVVDPEFRDVHNEYLEIRFDFNRRLNDNDIIKSAKIFSEVVDNPQLAVRHVSLKRKSSCFEDVNGAALYWKERAAKRRTPSFQGTRPHSATSELLTPDRAKGEDFSDYSPIVEQKQKKIILPHGGNFMTFAEQDVPSHMLVILPSEGTHVDNRTQADEGVSYHLRMVLVRTAENCQSAFGWMKDKVIPRGAQR